MAGRITGRHTLIDGSGCRGLLDQQLIQRIELHPQPPQPLGGILVGLTLDDLSPAAGLLNDLRGSRGCSPGNQRVRTALPKLVACIGEHGRCFGARQFQHLFALLEPPPGSLHLLRHAQPELVDELQDRRPVNQRPFRQRHMPAGSQDVLEPIQVVEQVTARSLHIHGCVLFHAGPADPQEHGPDRDGLVSRL